MNSFKMRENELPFRVDFQPVEYSVKRGEDGEFSVEDSEWIREM